MQMTIECPTDGQVTVDVTDVNAIVFDRAGRCEISFICPVCGRELRQPVTPVAMQMAIVEPADLAEAGGSGAEGVEVCEPTPGEDECRIELDPAKAEAYLEYFRRQLADVEDVEAALKEIDS